MRYHWGPADAGSTTARFSAFRSSIAGCHLQFRALRMALNIVNSLISEVVHSARGSGEFELSNREVAFCPFQLQRQAIEGILFLPAHAPSEGDHLEAKLIFRAATWLLAVAFVSGLAMALIRFGTEKPSPPWVAKLHGLAAAAALSLLIFGWANVGVPRAGLFGLLTLLLAAAGGLFLNLGYHWRQKPLPEWLVFAHMSIAFIGFLVVGAVTLSLSLSMAP
jgi:hypothetical protein